MELKPALAREPINGDIRFDTSDDRPDYIGVHIMRNAPTANLFWTIYKITYLTTAADFVTRIQKRTTSYDDRATGW